MATIGFIMLSEAGHYHPTYALARRLKARGHRVVYYGIRPFERETLRNGVEFVRYLEDIYPNEELQLSTQGMGLRQQLRTETENVRRTHAFWLGEDAGRVFGQARPDLLVVDSYMPQAALAACRYDIPSILLSVTFPQDEEPGIPPISTRLLPGDTPAERKRIQAAWRALYRNTKIKTKLGGLFGFDVDYVRLTQQLAAQCGYPAAKIRTDRAFMPGLDLPELILCPQAFDFPRPDRANRYYVESSITFEEEHATFPWERLDDARPLVFCTMGSQSHRGRGIHRFFQAAIDAFAAHPDWQLVVAIGRHLDVNELRCDAQNVTVVNWAPHTALLERSTVMINHAGLGTIKQCIYFGVPMIVFPFMRDQPGNAARVLYHRLGAMGDLRSASPAMIGRMTSDLLADSGYSDRTRAMQQVFRSVETSGVGVSTVEQFIPVAV